MPRIICIDRPTLDYDLSGMKEFGEGPVYLFEDKRHAPSVFNYRKACEILSARLRELRFDPEEDIVCVIGSAQWISFFFAHLGYEGLNVLLFNRGTRKYELQRWDMGTINDNFWEVPDVSHR